MTTEGMDIARRDQPSWNAPMPPGPIQTPVEYETAANALRDFKSFEKRVTEWFGPLKSGAYDHWKALVAKEKEVLEPARAWEAEVKRSLADYDTKQEGLRQAEERRLAEIARKQEEDRRLAEAAALEAEGIAEASPEKLAEAEQLLDAPVETPVVFVPKEIPKVNGISYREGWDAKIVDLQKLIRHVAEHPELQNLLQPNTTALRQMARSLKDKLVVPGVRSFSTKVVAAR